MKRELEEYFPQVFGKYYYDCDNEVINVTQMWQNSE